MRSRWGSSARPARSAAPTRSRSAAIVRECLKLWAIRRQLVGHRLIPGQACNDRRVFGEPRGGLAPNCADGPPDAPQLANFTGDRHHHRAAGSEVSSSSFPGWRRIAAKRLCLSGGAGGLACHSGGGTARAPDRPSRSPTPAVTRQIHGSFSHRGCSIRVCRMTLSPPSSVFHQRVACANVGAENVRRFIVPSVGLPTTVRQSFIPTKARSTDPLSASLNDSTATCGKFDSIIFQRRADLRAAQEHRTATGLRYSLPARDAPRSAGSLGGFGCSCRSLRSM